MAGPRTRKLELSPLGDGGGGNFHAERVMRPREQVEQQIRSAILSGRFKQGERLPSEAQLTEMFGVGRSTVREALRSLANSGLIFTTPGAAGGSFIEGLDATSLRRKLGETLEHVVHLGRLSDAEVAEVRSALDVKAAALAAEHRTTENLDELEAALETAESGDGAADLAFRSSLAEASGNGLVAALLFGLHRLSGPATKRVSPRQRQDYADARRSVFEAIKAGDSELAAEAMLEAVSLAS